jgi:hypothetical protein
MHEEFDSDLHNERSLISVELRANTDAFPLQGEVAVYGIGIFGDKIDLIDLVSLCEVRVLSSIRITNC